MRDKVAVAGHSGTTEDVRVGEGTGGGQQDHPEHCDLYPLPAGKVTVTGGYEGNFPGKGGCFHVHFDDQHFIIWHFSKDAYSGRVPGDDGFVILKEYPKPLDYYTPVTDPALRRFIIACTWPVVMG